MSRCSRRRDAVQSGQSQHQRSGQLQTRFQQAAQQAQRQQRHQDQQPEWLDAIHLSDFKVRILEASQGTDAVTRVLVTSTDGNEKWDTVGVDPNIVEASWRALSDAYTYAILRSTWRDA